MPSVSIDASVLAVPELESTAEDAHRYIDTILDWRRLLDEPWVEIYMSDRASEILFDTGLYPLRDQLIKLFIAHGIVEYDVYTVAIVVDNLLRRTPHFETYFKVHDVLFDDVTTNPDILKFSSGTVLKSDLARCVILIAILRDHCSEPVRDHSLILRQAPNRQIQVRALIHELDHDREDVRTIPVPPKYFKGTVLVCEDFRGLIENLDESAILLCATDQFGVEIAVRIALFKSRLTRGNEPDWDDIGGLRTGAMFFDSVKGCCKNQAKSFADRLLRAVVETIDRQNIIAVHSLRTGAGGNAPQRMRGRDKAMRRDIDYEYHLHYWHCDDGAIELASVGVHNDFSIPE